MTQLVNDGCEGMRPGIRLGDGGVQFMRAVWSGESYISLLSERRKLYDGRRGQALSDCDRYRQNNTAQ